MIRLRSANILDFKMDENSQEQESVAKQLTELKSELQDVATRISISLNTHSAAITQLTDQIKVLNVQIERLWRKN